MMSDPKYTKVYDGASHPCSTPCGRNVKGRDSVDNESPFFMSQAAQKSNEGEIREQDHANARVEHEANHCGRQTTEQQFRQEGREVGVER